VAVPGGARAPSQTSGKLVYPVRSLPPIPTRRLLRLDARDPLPSAPSCCYARMTPSLPPPPDDLSCPWTTASW
jgi:hypothetical protein